MSANEHPTGPDISGHPVSPYYGYLPTLWISLLFLSLFSIASVLHVTQSLRTRTWWLLPTVVLACCGEVLGWAARAWSFYHPLDIDPYLIQTVSLVVSPTPLIGALFIAFGCMTDRLGQQYSRLGPKLYSRIFLTSDVVALLVQSVGGGIAASSRDTKVEELGSHIILAGVVFQLASLTVFCALLAEYLVRYTRHSPMQPASSKETLIDPAVVSQPTERSMDYLAVGICVSTALLYIRALYRTVELADGWGGRVIRTQSVFVVFDGVMVFLTVLVLNVYHPGHLLRLRSTAKPSQYLHSKYFV